MKTLQLAALTAALLGLISGAHAHGDHAGWKPPAAGTRGVDRGVQFALSCDHTIHELLSEYDSCLGYYTDQMAADPEAATAFWYVALVRARSALQNGYADGAQFVALFEGRYRQAQTRHPVPEARLCRTIDAPCPAPAKP